MKRRLRLFGLSALLAAVFSCDPTDSPATPVNPVSVTVSPSALAFAAENAPAQSVMLSSDGAWRVTPGDSWFTVTPLTGNGAATLQVSVGRNAGGARSATFTVAGTDGILAFYCVLFAKVAL